MDGSLPRFVYGGIMVKKEFVTLAVKDIVPYDNNPRKNDEAVKDVIESIKQCENLDPIEVDEDNVILSGHTRLKALEELDFQETECIRYTGLTKAQKKKYRLLANKTGEKALWDFEKLAEELQDLDFEGYDFGFELDFGEEEQEVVEDDFNMDEELKKPVFSKTGDLWIMGKHRLLCGDSCKTEDVERLMDGQKADMVFTDPPWNVNYGSQTNHPSWKSRSIENDHMSTEDFKKFMESVFGQMNRASKDGAMTYVVMSAQEWGNLMLALKDNDYHWSSTIIWKKDTLVLSRKDYHTQYEPIWYGWKEGTRLHPLKDRKQSDVCDIDRPKRSDEHPTMKPIALVARAIQNSSDQGNVILDLFGGSGTTMLAAEQTGRQSMLMELDPKYVDVIVNRYREYCEVNELPFKADVIRDGKCLSYEQVAPQE